MLRETEIDEQNSHFSHLVLFTIVARQNSNLELIQQEHLHLTVYYYNKTNKFSPQRDTGRERPRQLLHFRRTVIKISGLSQSKCFINLK